MRADCLLNTSAIDKQEKIAYVRSALHDQVKLTYDIVVIRGGQQLAGPFGCRLGLLLTVRDRDRGGRDRPLALFILLGHCGVFIGPIEQGRGYSAPSVEGAATEAECTACAPARVAVCGHMT